MEIEQRIGNGDGELMTATIGRIESVDVLEAEIEELTAGMDRALERRLELHAQAEEIIAETEGIDASLRDARAKADRLRQALALAREAAELTPNLPAELKPAGGFEAPPTEEPPAPTPGDEDEIPAGAQRCRSTLIPPDELPPVGGPVDQALADAASPEAHDAGEEGVKPADLPGSREEDDHDEGAGASPEPRGSGDDEAEASEPVAATKTSIADTIVDAMRGQGKMKQAEIRERMPEGGGSVNSMRFALQGLVKAGTVKAEGERASRRYWLPETKTPTTPAAERKARPSSEDKPKSQSPVADRQPPTDEGKVLSALQLGRQDIAALSIAVGITIPALRTILGKLIREGDVRLHKGDPPEYYLAP